MQSAGSVFEQQVAAEGLDQYEIDFADGHRGECGRMKAEQFKRLYPSKMVIVYESPTADDPLTWPGGTWAGYYLLMNRTTAAGPVTAAQTTITVADPSAFSVGDTAVMWSPAVGDAFANSEWVSGHRDQRFDADGHADFFANRAHRPTRRRRSSRPPRPVRAIPTPTSTSPTWRR